MRKISNLFIAAALSLFHAMRIIVAYNYRDMLCGITHSGYSAPAWVAFLHIIPFGVAVILCITVVFSAEKQSNQ